MLFSVFQVKRELSGVLIFESHANAGTVCKYLQTNRGTNRINIHICKTYKQMHLQPNSIEFTFPCIC